MKKENIIDSLNSLVEINNDRIEGYNKAIENTEEGDLKDLFYRFKDTSIKCKSELISEIQKSGGKVTNGTTTSGKFFRTWMDVKSAFRSKDRKAILDSCEFGEENAVDVYNDVLGDKSDDLDLHQIDKIESQLNLLKADQRDIHTMQNSLVATS